MAEQKSSVSRVVVSPPGLAAYAYVFKPQAPRNNAKPGEQAQYKLTLVLDKDEKTLAPLRAVVKAVAEERWGAGASGIKSPFLDGDDSRYRDNAMYRGKIFIRTKSSSRPGVVGTERDPFTNALTPILPESEGGRGELEFYSGCLCRASIYAFPYDTDGNKGVSFLLNNVQKLADGERLSGRRAAEDDFDEWTAGTPSESKTKAEASDLF